MLQEGSSHPVQVPQSLREPGSSCVVQDCKSGSGAKRGSRSALGLQSLRDSLVDKGEQQKNVCREGVRLGLSVGIKSI